MRSRFVPSDQGSYIGSSSSAMFILFVTLVSSNIQCIQTYPTPHFFGSEENGRRYFPKGSSKNCPIGAIGASCSDIPTNQFSDAPDWAGEIYSKLANCTRSDTDNDTDNGIPSTCTDSGIPKSLNDISTLPGGLLLHKEYKYIGFKEEHSFVLSEFTVSTNAIIAVDLDKNGLVDFVVGNSERLQIILNPDRRTGAIQNKETIFEAPLSIKTVVVGDVNNDTFPDIIIGTSSGIYDKNNILFLNTGTDGKTFEEPRNLDVPGHERRTFDLAIADINMDGYMDIIVANNRGDEKNQVYLNDGRTSNGTSFTAEDLPGDSLETYAIAVADVTGDGYPDIILGNDGQPNKLLIYNSDNETFQDPVDLHFGEEQDTTRTRAIGIADTDGDGHLDIVIGNFYHDNMLYINSGDKSSISTPFKTSQTIKSGEKTFAIGLADVDNNGYVDIILGNDEGESNQILLNNGGDEPFQDLIDLPASNRGETKAIAVADMDGDKYVDIVTGLSGRNIIFMNTGIRELTFQTSEVLPSNSDEGTMVIVAADINGDGHTDIIIGNKLGENLLLINSGGNGKLFEAPTTLPGGSNKTYAIAVAEVTGDENVDIIIGNGNDEENLLLINNGYGDGGITFTPKCLPAGLRATRAIAVAYVNNDNYIDIIFGNTFSNTEDGDVNVLLINNGNVYNANDDNTLPFEEFVNLPGESSNTMAVAATDMNEDGLVDIIFANEDQSNLLLINSGVNSGDDQELFQKQIKLGKNEKTQAVVVADVNNDGKMDIIFGHKDEGNQLFLTSGFNESATFFAAPISLDEAGDTSALAVLDVNGDGFVDVIVGNTDSSNQLLINDGTKNGNFHASSKFPRNDQNTQSIVVVDVDGDGFLDILIGNEGQSNQLMLYSTCPNGGAQLHSKSWCYSCPPFMGRLVRPSSLTASSVCKECLPDHLQEKSDFSDQCSDISCPQKFRKFGRDTCESCPNGTFYNDNINPRVENNNATWSAIRCVECPEGEYANDNIVAINQCFKCHPGQFQGEVGKANCDFCPEGKFQPEFGQTNCIACETGGYCNPDNKINGGFQQCPQGTYNENASSTGRDSCIQCPRGKFSIDIGAKTSNVCLPCLSGYFTNKTGENKCEPCPPGSFVNKTGQTKCHPCAQGTYSDKEGLATCIPCPYRLNSATGSTTCPFCDSGFYLNDPSTSENEIFKKPDKYCKECPHERSCSQPNTTIKILDIPEMYWRDSIHTSQLYRCNDRHVVCVGYNNPSEHRSLAAESPFNNRYCKDGHTGPLCEVCTDKEHYYFSTLEGKCTLCPSTRYVVLKASLIVGFIIIVGAAIRVAIKRLPVAAVIITSLSLQAKIKVVISFYQVISSLETIYGVKLDDSLADFFDIWNYFSFDIFSLTFPRSCVGSMERQLILSSTWPYGIIVLIAIVLALNHVLAHGRKPVTSNSGKLDTVRRAVYLFIAVFYLALPTVSRSIFDAIKCKPFKSNDLAGAFSSYLLADMSISCNDEDYASLERLFWIFFALWPLLVPLVFMVLLLTVHKSVRENRMEPLANACRFLWDDYSPSMWFWDVFDTYRKLALTGLIMFVDPTEGSNRLFRSILGCLVSVIYLGTLSIARPYKRDDDFYLAFVANSLLLCCFIVGIILKLCSDQVSGDETCHDLVLSSLNSKRASFVVLVLTASMMCITILFLVIIAISTITKPVVRLKISGYVPDLKMNNECKYHMFMSHVWATGQEKTHAIVRKLQVLMPGLKVFLDVDELEDISKLETHVSESAVFYLFYSEGYFRSKNCRREIYAAIEKKKPIVVLHAGDESELNMLRIECTEHCTKKPGFENILQQLFKYDPIRWLQEGAFSAAAAERIFMSLLSHLPSYQNASRYLLDQGLKVPNELSPVALQCPRTVFVCEINDGAREVAEELKAMISTSNEKLEIQIIGNSIIPHNEENLSANDVYYLQEGKSLGNGVYPAPVSASKKEELDDDLSIDESTGLTTSLKFIPSDNYNIELDDDLPYPQDRRKEDEKDTYDESKINQLEAQDELIQIEENHPLDDDLSVANETKTTIDAKVLEPNNHADGHRDDHHDPNHIRIPDIDLSHIDPKTSVLLLYLNQNSFLDEGNVLAGVVKAAKAEDCGLHIIVVHEKDPDPAKGGCPFDLFFKQTPQVLIDPPNEIYKKTAIPLYTRREYRVVSLGQIILSIRRGTSRGMY